MSNAALGTLGGFSVFVVLFLVILAILWFILPFAIFGTKGKLDSLIHEMRLMNLELAKLRKQLLANSQSGGLVESKAQVQSASALTHDQIMAKYNISNDGDKYIFRGHRYDRLEDAVAYAVKKGSG